MNTYEIDKSKIGKRVGCILGSDGEEEFSNIVIGYINGQNPILIRTNLSQSQWNDFCDGKLSKQELDKYI